MINKYTVKLESPFGEDYVFNVTEDQYDRISLFLIKIQKEGRYAGSDNPMPAEVYGQDGLM